MLSKEDMATLSANEEWLGLLFSKRFEMALGGLRAGYTSSGSIIVVAGRELGISVSARSTKDESGT